MRTLAIVHQADAGPGVFAQAVRDSGATMDTWLLPAEGPPGDPLGYDAVLTFGGAMHVDQADEHPWLEAENELLRRLLAAEVPLLGVCLGAQLVATAAGGTVRRAGDPEIGWYRARATGHAQDDPLMAPLGPAFEALEWHSYEFLLPPGAVPLAASEACLQAYRLGPGAWGIQFHAEVMSRDYEAWLDDYRSDSDAVAMGLDVEQLRAAFRVAGPAWNELGRALCRRFVTVAAERSPRRR